MNIFWTQHLKELEDKNRFADYVRNSEGVLERIREFLRLKERTVDNPSKVDYNTQSWAYAMADTIGYRRALKEVYELLQTTPTTTPLTERISTDDNSDSVRQQRPKRRYTRKGQQQQ